MRLLYITVERPEIPWENATQFSWNRLAVQVSAAG